MKTTQAIICFLVAMLCLLSVSTEAAAFSCDCNCYFNTKRRYNECIDTHHTRDYCTRIANINKCGTGCVACEYGDDDAAPPFPKV